MPRTIATVDDVALWSLFPAAFKQARLVAGISQGRLEMDLHLGQHVVSPWERGLRRPGWQVLMRVGRMLGLHPANLFPHPRAWWYPTDVALAAYIASRPAQRPRQVPADWSSPVPVACRGDASC